MGTMHSYGGRNRPAPSDGEQRMVYQTMAEMVLLKWRGAPQPKDWVTHGHVFTIPDGMRVRIALAKDQAPESIAILPGDHDVVVFAKVDASTRSVQFTGWNRAYEVGLIGVQGMDNFPESGKWRAGTGKASHELAYELANVVSGEVERRYPAECVAAKESLAANKKLKKLFMGVWREAASAMTKEDVDLLHDFGEEELAREAERLGVHWYEVQIEGGNISPEDFLDIIVAKAKQAEIEGRSGNTSFVYRADGRISAAELAFETDEEKYARFTHVSMFARFYRATAIAFVSDVWIGTGKPDIRPVDDPDRREGLYAVLILPDGTTSKSISISYTRNEDGAISEFGELVTSYEYQDQRLIPPWASMTPASEVN
jgi:hypothetical protein